MKKLLLGLTVVMSISASATEFTVEERAQLHTLKMMLEMQQEQVKEVVVTTQKNAEAFDRLSRFSLSERRQLRAKNCADVKSVIGANMMMVAAALEQSKTALTKVEVSEENGLTFQENYLEYIKSARKASSDCKNIEKSADAMATGASKLDIASEILIEALPELIEE